MCFVVNKYEIHLFKPLYNVGIRKKVRKNILPTILIHFLINVKIEISLFLWDGDSKYYSY